MKTLKFSKNLIPLILSDEKNITWRLFDDKDLKEGDEVMFLNSETKKAFARVIPIEVKEKTFRELTKEDKEGHGEFETEDEMFKTYSDCYKTEVNSNTSLKIIKFKVLEKI